MAFVQLICHPRILEKNYALVGTISAAISTQHGRPMDSICSPITSFHSLVSHSNQQAPFKCKIHDVMLTNDVATENARSDTVQNFIVGMINLCSPIVSPSRVPSRNVVQSCKREIETTTIRNEGGIAVLPIVQIPIPTLSRKHHRHPDCRWCDCERAATERMKERESFLDGQWYRGKVQAQFRKGKLEATRNVDRERGAARARPRAGACGKVGECGEVTGFIKVQSAGLKNNRRT